MFSIQKKNKLLDGTYHIQTIGEPLKYIEFTVVANELQTEKINLMETKGELLKLIDYNRFFIGFINNRVDWKRLTVGYIDREKRLYEGRISIIVKEESDIK